MSTLDLGFEYLASPYSHPNDMLRYLRFKMVEAVGVELLKQGRVIFSPIIYCHRLAVENQLPKDAEFWKKLNFSFLEKSKGLIILQLPGWEESKGIVGEREEAERLSLPISYLTMDSFNIRHFLARAANYSTT